MSLRITPQPTHPTSTTNTTTRTANTHLQDEIPITLPHPSKGAPSAPGVPDTLRTKLTSSPSSTTSPSSAHPLESRLLAWRATQDAMKMESLRRAYGIAEPVRRGMEMKIVREGSWRPALLGPAKGGDVHEEILAIGGRDAEVGWEDVFAGDEFREPPSFHDEMEKRLRMEF